MSVAFSRISQVNHEGLKQVMVAGIHAGFMQNMGQTAEAAGLQLQDSEPKSPPASW